jgi:hypothetical protein
MQINWHNTNQALTHQHKEKIQIYKQQIRNEHCCHNPNLGLATKARACKGAGQEGSPGVTSHAPGSAKECEGMNPHPPKWTPILGVGVPVDSQIFRGQFQGSKFIELKSSLCHWKSLGT